MKPNLNWYASGYVAVLRSPIWTTNSNALAGKHGWNSSTSVRSRASARRYSPPRMAQVRFGLLLLGYVGAIYLLTAALLHTFSSEELKAGLLPDQGVAMDSSSYAMSKSNLGLFGKSNIQL